jgi:hypothetical protein
MRNAGGTALLFAKYRLLRMTLFAGLTALAFGVCGCWAAALQLAPIGIQAVEAVGSGAVQLAEAATISGHQKSKNAADEDHPNEDEVDREERCDELELEIPGVVEIRKNTTGAPQYRELHLGGSPDEPQWAPVLDKDTGPGGWQTAVNFMQMNFTPPLDGALPETGTSYLAYAATEPQSDVERDRLVALTVNFGSGAGTFTWNGRGYQYVVKKKLPCFPPPPSG